jgi:hypothetical protein
MLNGHRVSLSTARFLPPDTARDLEAARDLAILWERQGKPVRPDEYAPIVATLEPPPADTPHPENVGAAVAAYMADARDRGNSEASLDKKRTLFEKQLVGYCREKGIRFLSS